MHSGYYLDFNGIFENQVVLHFVCLATAVSHFSFAILKYFTFSVS